MAAASVPWERLGLVLAGIHGSWNQIWTSCVVSTMTDRSDRAMAELEVIEAYLDGALTPAQRQAFEQRLVLEPSLRERLARERKLRALLSELPAVTMRPGFAEEALATARRGAGLQRRWTLLAPALAAALTAVAMLGWQRTVRAPSPSPETVATLAGASGDDAVSRSVVVTLGRAEVLRLRINSNQAVRPVRFVLQLPDGLALDNAPDVRRLEWEGELEQGVNVLSLPVRGLAAQTADLDARVILPDGERRLSLRVHVVPEGHAL